MTKNLVYVGRSVASALTGLSMTRLIELAGQGAIVGERTQAGWMFERHSLEDWTRTYRRASSEKHKHVDAHESPRQLLARARLLPWISEEGLARRLGSTPEDLDLWATSGVPDVVEVKLRALLQDESRLTEVAQLAASLIGLDEGEAWTRVAQAGAKWVDITGDNGITLERDPSRVRVVIASGKVASAYGG